jgi:hypothetical protein
MGYIEVQAADIADGRIQRLRVRMPHLPARTIDRAAAIAYLRDGHSLIPIADGMRRPGLQLVDVGEDEPAWFIRADNARTPEDTLPTLPKVSS